MFKTFNQLNEEYSFKDLKYIKNIAKNLTYAFELELEISSSEELDNTITRLDNLPIALSKYLKSLNINSNKIQEIIDNIDFDMLDFFNIDYIDVKLTFKLKELLKEWIKNNKIIPFNETKDKFIQNFNTFYQKWKDELKFMEDTTLKNGIEVAPTKYLIGYEKAIEFITDFYSDYNNQSYFQFSETTGLHINIGIEGNIHWNYIKGLLLVDDNREGNFIFKNIENRIKSRFVQSIKPNLLKLISKNSKLNELKIQFFDNIQEIETILNKMILTIFNEGSYKDYGYNFHYLYEKNYMEFRQVGGNVKLETVVEKLNLFTYIVYAMANENFKKNSYISKLWKFLSI